MMKSIEWTGLCNATSLLLAVSLLFTACDTQEEEAYEIAKIAQVELKVANISGNKLTAYIDGMQRGNTEEQLVLFGDKGKVVVKEKGNNLEVYDNASQSLIYQKQITGTPFTETVKLFYDGKTTHDRFSIPAPKPGYTLFSFYLSFTESNYTEAVDIVLTKTELNPTTNQQEDTGEELASLTNVQPGQFSEYLEYDLANEEGYLVHIYKVGEKEYYLSNALPFTVHNVYEGSVAALILEEEKKEVLDPNVRTKIMNLLTDMRFLDRNGIVSWFNPPETTDPSTWPELPNGISKWPSTIDPTKPLTWPRSRDELGNVVSYDKKITMSIKTDVAAIFKEEQ